MLETQITSLENKVKNKKTWQQFCFWLLLAFVLLGLDQATKYVARTELGYGETLIVIPGFFNIMLAYNTGAAFSFLADESGWQRYVLTGLALVVSIWILVSLYRRSEDTSFCLPFSFVLSGALGNAIDRILLGKVTDFIQLYYRGWYYPTFNIADSAITVAVIMLVTSHLWNTKKVRQ